MSFGSNVTPPRFGAGKPVEVAEVEPDPEPIPNLPVHMNDTTLNDCYRCGHRGNNPVPGCACCAQEHTPKEPPWSWEP